MLFTLLVAACGAGGPSAQSPPSALSYASPAVARVGTAETFMPTTIGVATRYAISPALPSGLDLDPATGVIAGSAAHAADARSYTITASNGFGSTQVTWVLSVEDAPPAGLTYSSPLTAVVGVPLSAAPSVSGQATSYAVNPALPGGLTLDPVSGVISGTPSTPSAQAAYTITASDSAGSTNFELVLTVNAAPVNVGPAQPPSGLSYSSPLTAVVGTPLTVAPSVSGTATSYTVSPTLPAGLNIDPVAGVISGTPAAPTGRATYIVTASSSAGATTFGWVLTVNGPPSVGSAQAPAGLNYTSPLAAAVGIALNVAPAVTGTVTAYAITPALPAGLTLNTVNGVISGTPTAAAAPATYAISASNASGSTAFNLSLSVAPPAPTFAPGAGVYPAYDSDPLPLPLPSTFQIAQIVTLTTPVGVIYYTLDGSTPTTASAIYSPSAPLRLSLPSSAATTSFTVNAMSLVYVGGVGLTSPIASATYTLTAPGTPVPSALPSGIFPTSFLYNPDTTTDQATIIANSCAYYGAIGAEVPDPVTGVDCVLNADGVLNSDGSYFSFPSFKNGITIDTWLQAAQVYPYSPPASATNVMTGAAQFVNVMDLNFTRLHHAVSYIPSAGAAVTAAYVCNYPGPDFYQSQAQNGPESWTVENQSAVDGVILNALNGINPFPCVVMDSGVVYPANPGATLLSNGQPYVRFLAFNPAGNLIPTVNLDGLHGGTIATTPPLATSPPPAMPNACTPCHGGSYPITVSSAPAHFLPFDENNFAYASLPGYRRIDQATQFKNLNSIVLNSTPPPPTAVADLIRGWYGPNLTAADAQPYWPATMTNSLDIQVYQQIWGPLCRTCHTANNFPFEPLTNGTVNGSSSPAPTGMLFLFDEVSLCNPSSALTMPNSRVIFDRFWSTHVNPNGNGTNYAVNYMQGPPQDLVLLLQQYINDYNLNDCTSPGLSAN